MDRCWVGLLSGGKDSSWAIHRALARGLPVTHALTARPTDDSYLFHVPAIDLAALIAESIGLAHRTFPVERPADHDASAVGDAELDTLGDALASLSDEANGELEGVVTGAVASRFQYDRIVALCDRLDIKQFSPLWQCDPEEALPRMIEAGFDIRVVAVAAEGLDRDWLGRRLDADAFEDLLVLQDRYGVHPMGEGGEFETVVVDGPHMQRPLRFEATERWDGTRGALEITDAWLADSVTPR